MKPKLSLLELMLLSALIAVVIYAIVLGRQLDASQKALRFSGTCSSITNLHLKVIRDNQLSAGECEFLFRVDGELFSLDVEASRSGLKSAWFAPAKTVLIPLDSDGEFKAN